MSYAKRERWCRYAPAVLVMLVAILVAACTGRGADNTTALTIAPDSTLADSAAPKAIENIGGGGLGLGDPPVGPLGGGPVIPVGGLQSLADYSEGQINPRTDIVGTVQVQIGQGLPETVTQLSSDDPFTGRYQLEDGTIVCTALPIEDVLNPAGLNNDPPIVNWIDGIKLFDGQIILTFIPAASQLAIEQFISANNLTTMFSLFYPNATGNDLAVFQFEYDALQYATFNAAYLYFSQQSLVVEAEPNSVNQIETDYANPNGPGYDEPNDFHYTYLDSRFIFDLGIDVSEHIPYGPMGEDGGEWFSDQVIAVIDTGVWRDHEEFAFV